MQRTGTSADDYRRLILAADREQFSRPTRSTSRRRPTTGRSSSTRRGLRNQFDVAFGRSMLFGNGLSALLTLMGISALLVVLFILGPLLVAGEPPGAGMGAWLVYFGALGAGFMLLEVALLQRFVLLLGHPVYSLTVTLFSLLLGTGLGSFLSRRIDAGSREGRDDTRSWSSCGRRARERGLPAARSSTSAIPWPLALRVVVAGALLVPTGVLLGMPLPAGMRLLATRATGHRSVGLGHQRRVLRGGRDGCRVRRDELGIFRHSVDCRRSSTRQRPTLRLVTAPNYPLYQQIEPSLQSRLARPGGCFANCCCTKRR